MFQNWHNLEFVRNLKKNYVSHVKLSTKCAEYAKLSVNFIFYTICLKFLWNKISIVTYKKYVSYVAHIQEVKKRRRNKKDNF